MPCLFHPPSFDHHNNTGDIPVIIAQFKFSLFYHLIWWYQNNNLDVKFCILKIFLILMLMSTASYRNHKAEKGFTVFSELCKLWSSSLGCTKLALTKIIMYCTISYSIDSRSAYTSGLAWAVWSQKFFLFPSKHKQPCCKVNQICHLLPNLLIGLVLESAPFCLQW